MRYKRALCLISLIAVAGLGTGLTPAVEPPAQPPATQAAPSSRPVEAVTFSFKGGSAGEYIAALRNAVKPRPINVVFKGNADSVRLPALELTNVSVGTAIKTLDRINEQGADSGRVFIDRVLDDGGEPVYAIIMWKSQTDATLAPQSTDVFSIRGITEPAPTDPDGVQVSLPSSVVLSALEAILSVDTAKEAPAPVLKYHPDSGLVVVRAFEDQLLLVRRAIGTMQDDADRRRAMYATIDLGAVQVELQRSSIKLQGAVDRMNVAEQEYERIRKQVAEGQIPQQEEINAAAQVRTLEREAEIARLETAALQKRFGRIQKLQDSVSDDKATK